MATEADAEPIPDELLDPPSGDHPPPPVETVEPVLPLHGLSPADFERLSLYLARLEGSPRRARRYGIPGQAQAGIDIYSALPSGRYATYQCKRYEALSPSDIAGAVKVFLSGKWAGRSEKFVFVTSASADRTELEEEIEAQIALLAARTPSILFVVWDQEEVSRLLRDHRDAVKLYFGPHWLRRFFAEPEITGITIDDLQAAVAGAMSTAAGPTLITNDWAPPRLRPRLDDLQRNDAGLFSTLTEQFGNPPEALLRGHD